jgi:hypothetical protein
LADFFSESELYIAAAAVSVFSDNKFCQAWLVISPLAICRER